MGIQEDQHPLIKNGKYTLPLALYYLGNDEKTYLCKFLEGVKMPRLHLMFKEIGGCEGMQGFWWQNP
jgi:hypothetical protein